MCLCEGHCLSLSLSLSLSLCLSLSLSLSLGLDLGLSLGLLQSEKLLVGSAGLRSLPCSLLSLSLRLKLRLSLKLRLRLRSRRNLSRRHLALLHHKLLLCLLEQLNLKLLGLLELLLLEELRLLLLQPRHLVLLLPLKRRPLGLQVSLFLLALAQVVPGREGEGPLAPGLLAEGPPSGESVSSARNTHSDPHCSEAGHVGS